MRKSVRYCMRLIVFLCVWVRERDRGTVRDRESMRERVFKR